MSLEENLADLQRHADDFAARRGFTYTVLESSSDDVIGCVYIYPSNHEGYDVDVQILGACRSSRARRAAVSGRVERGSPPTWPFENINQQVR